MANEEAAVKERLATQEGEAHEPSPESGVREKPKTPESISEAKGVVSQGAEAATTEAKAFSEEVLTGPEYQQAAPAVNEATTSAIHDAAVKAERGLTSVKEQMGAAQPSAREQHTISPEESYQKAYDGYATLEQEFDAANREANMQGNEKAAVQFIKNREKLIAGLRDIRDKAKAAGSDAVGFWEEKIKEQEAHVHVEQGRIDADRPASAEAPAPAAAEAPSMALATFEGNQEVPLEAPPAATSEAAPAEAKAEAPQAAAPEAAPAEKEKGDPMPGLMGKLDGIIAEYKAAGLNADAGLSRRMRNLILEARRADPTGTDPKLNEITMVMGRLKAAMDGDRRSWSTPQGMSLENDYAALKKQLSGGARTESATPAAEAASVGQPGPIEKAGIAPGEAANDNARPAAERATAPKPGVAAEQGKAENAAAEAEVVEATAEQIANMDDDQYEKYMTANIKGREMRLENLYAIGADQRTPDQQHEIDYLELTNGMERKSIEKRKEEAKLKALEARAAELEALIMALEPAPAQAPPPKAPETALALAPEEGLPALPPAPSTAMELAKPEGSTAMVLAEDADMLVLKRQQLAEVRKAIEGSLAAIAGLAAAIAQLDRIRKRMPKPVAEAAAPVAKKAEVAVAAAAGGAEEKFGAPAIEYQAGYQKPEKKKDGGPDAFDVVLSAMHGDTAPLVNKVSKAVSKATGEH